jgi:hypothetical protein
MHVWGSHQRLPAIKTPYPGIQVNDVDKNGNEPS